MIKISNIIWGVFYMLSSLNVFATEKFDVLPDLPEPLAAAQASSITTADTLTTQAALHEPSLISIVFSMIFVILLIYATGIIYTKLNKFGIKTLKQNENFDSKVSVISTTPLGSNKTLHVVELGGKRMLIGACSGAIQLIKDLGTYPPQEFDENSFSKIEIPNIRIPRIEIPKIEFPNIGFTKTAENTNDETKAEEAFETSAQPDNKNDSFEISEIYEEDEPDGIIDKLFTPEQEPINNTEVEVKTGSDEHKVDPDEFALYKKYFPLGAGSIFTFEIKGGKEAAWKFIDNLKIFSLLANVADVKSLVIHPATTTHSQLTEAELAEQGISQSTIRLSIGTEHIDDIIADLDAAFKAAK